MKYKIVFKSRPKDKDGKVIEYVGVFFNNIFKITINNTIKHYPQVKLFCAYREPSCGLEYIPISDFRFLSHWQMRHRVNDDVRRLHEAYVSFICDYLKNTYEMEGITYEIVDLFDLMIEEWIN
jgi:hypothetical protein